MRRQCSSCIIISIGTTSIGLNKLAPCKKNKSEAVWTRSFWPHSHSHRPTNTSMLVSEQEGFNHHEGIQVSNRLSKRLSFSREVLYILNRIFTANWTILLYLASWNCGSQSWSICPRKQSAFRRTKQKKEKLWMVPLGYWARMTFLFGCSSR